MIYNEEKAKKLLARLKEADENFDLTVEYGSLLMIHVNDMTEAQKSRLDEIRAKLKPYYSPQTLTNQPR